MNGASYGGSMAQIKAEIVDIATKMLEEKINLIEGCRQLSVLRYKVAPDNVFLTFVGVASETDEFPVGKQRDTWSSEALSRLDEERDVYLGEVKSAVLSACKEIIAKFA